MLKKRLNQYKGKLNSEQIAQGMNTAIENAKRLADTASLIFEYGDYALAVSISAISIEESGKLAILRSLAVARDNEEVAKCWREYRSHTKKNVMWPIMDLFAKGARCMNDFAPLFDKEAEHPFLLDQIKQLGFYTDCLGKGHWSIPEVVINKELAKTLVSIAGILAKNRKITRVEIDLWKEYIGPVWKGPKELMENGLVQWYREMQNQDLMGKGLNAMEEFILHGVQKSTPQDETTETAD